jgi:aryl-alcohol dehydrogenase-like predicted oxidoreductase
VAYLAVLGHYKELVWLVSRTPAQLALAWVLAQGEGIVPIPGTKRRRYLEENVAALDVRLTREELTEIDSLLPPGAAAGPRYTEQRMRTINR